MTCSNYWLGRGAQTCVARVMGEFMVLRDRMTSPEAVARWNRRSEALEAGAILLAQKPNREQWTHEELRVFRYALAVSRRMDKLQ